MTRCVGDHYGWPGLMDAIQNELHRDTAFYRLDITVNQLAPVDNYHAFGWPERLRLRAAGISATDRVLDVGGGIGGPARRSPSASAAT